MKQQPGKRGRENPPAPHAKTPVTIQIDPRALAVWKKMGKGWLQGMEQVVEDRVSPLLVTRRKPFVSNLLCLPGAERLARAKHKREAAMDTLKSSRRALTTAEIADACGLTSSNMRATLLWLQRADMVVRGSPVAFAQKPVRPGSHTSKAVWRLTAKGREQRWQPPDLGIPPSAP